MTGENYSMIILAGGESRRMGTDKADLMYEGRTFLELQIVMGVRLGITDILVSGYRGERCPLPVVADRIPDRGPLGGLEASLRATKHEKCVVLSVDVPLVPLEELVQLLECSAASPITILKNNGREQPLIGVYDRSLADEMLRELTESRGSVFAFINKTGYAVYESMAPAAVFANVNAPEQYRSMLK